MISNRIKLRAIVSGVALSVAAMSAQAATPPTLPTAGTQTQAVFTGGATLNGGASFLSTVPAADAADLIVNIQPAAGNVGQSGSIVVIASIPGMGLFMKLSGGIWIPWKASDPLQPMATKTLAATESVKVLSGLVGSDTNLAGMTIQAYVGYYTGGNVSNLTYTSTPASITIANVPAAGCPTNTTAVPGTTFRDKPVCRINTAARITTDTHLTANNSYLLTGTAFFGNNVATPNASKTKLTIDAGTYIFAPTGSHNLVIDKSAKIFANGSPTKPVIFTSELDNTVPGAGMNPVSSSSLWGGLAINGVATLNTASGFADGEGSTGQYGGGTSPNDDDDSGALTYVQIKYAGVAFNELNELNTLSLQGVGRGTIIDYVHSHNGGDDAIEFYGGTVNAKHLLLIGQDDDALDWTAGYRGKIQFVINKSIVGESCIEADNLEANNDAVPRSRPIVANVTCIGVAGSESDSRGFIFKAGTAGDIRNSVLQNPWAVGCIQIAGAPTFTATGPTLQSLTGNLTVRNTRLDSSCAFSNGSGSLWNVSDWFALQSSSSVGPVDLGGAKGWVNGSSINAVTPLTHGDSFFENTDYIGAVKDSTSDWTKGWTFLP